MKRISLHSPQSSTWTETLTMKSEGNVLYGDEANVLWGPQVCHLALESTLEGRGCQDHYNGKSQAEVRAHHASCLTDPPMSEGDPKMTAEYSPSCPVYFNVLLSGLVLPLCCEDIMDDPTLNARQCMLTMLVHVALLNSYTNIWAYHTNTL